MMPEALEFAQETARQAGQLLVDLYRQHHTVWHKSSDIDIVTEADLASEELIVRAIRSAFPDHRILSEEGLGALNEPRSAQSSSDGAAGEAPFLWLVDPLDGTVNYAHGFPCWGVSLALARRGTVLMALTHDPLLDETYWAERGGGAMLNEEPIRVSDVPELGDALVATGFAYRRSTLTDDNLAEFAAVTPHVQGVRRAGAAVLDLAYVAAGRLDAYWELHLNPWDWAAGWLLVEEAGGRVTDLQGLAWDLGKTNLVASNARLHQGLLQLLRHTECPDTQ
ncbi:inositol monophosphatase family protein [Chloroflexota bacterium]